MDERKFSCIKKVIKTVQIPLPATFIANEISGIKEILESWKRQYKKQLQGVVVNYRKITLSTSSGFIAPNKPFVYYNVTATFDLFCPKVGDIVKGKINRISNEHIGCLIEETINVTIHFSKNSNKESLPFINLNQEILFEISYFNYDRKEIRVTGKITSKCIQLMKDLFPPVTYANLNDTQELSNNIDEGIGTSSESTDDGPLNHSLDDSLTNDDENFKKPFSDSTQPKKSAKRSKNDSESSSVDASDITSSCEKPKKKKKRKDKSDPETTSAINLISDTVTCNALIESFSNFQNDDILEALKNEELSNDDSSIVEKHKKKKNSPTIVEGLKLSNKRKRDGESSLIDTSEQSTSDEMPKKKKKHKDKIDPYLEKEVKDEFLDMPVDDTGVLSIKKEKLSPVKAINNSLSEFKPKNKDRKAKDRNKDKKSKDKNKEKKSKDKDKTKKKKGKVLASGAVLKKDKKSHKKTSKKNKLDSEHSKKHKKDKNLKKNKDKEKNDSVPIKSEMN